MNTKFVNAITKRQHRILKQIPSMKLLKILGAFESQWPWGQIFFWNVMNMIAQERGEVGLSNSCYRCIYYKSQSSCNPSNLDIKVRGQRFRKSLGFSNLNHTVGAFIRRLRGSTGIFFRINNIVIYMKNNKKRIVIKVFVSVNTISLWVFWQ